MIAGDTLTDNNGDGYYAFNPATGQSTCSYHPVRINSNEVLYYTSDGTYVQVQIAVGTPAAWFAYFADGRSAFGQGIGGEPMTQILDKNFNPVTTLNTINPNPPYDSIQNSLNSFWLPSGLRSAPPITDVSHCDRSGNSKQRSLVGCDGDTACKSADALDPLSPEDQIKADIVVNGNDVHLENIVVTKKAEPAKTPAASPATPKSGKQ